MEGYISIRQIMDDIREHPLLKDINLERVVNYTYHFLRIVGAPRLFVDKVEEIKVENYRAKLPCDFIEVIQIRDINGNPFLYTTDNFHESTNKTPQNQYKCYIDNFQYQNLTYKIQGNVIFTSVKDCIIEIAYKALVVDEDGFPMLPDNSPFIKALEAYIKVQQFTILFDTGKISGQVLQNAQQEYAWAVGQAESDLHRMNVDQMQSFTNLWNTLLPRVNEHRNGFKTMNVQEKIRNH